MNCRTLTIRFANPLRPHEVPLLRGAVINALRHKLTLFHTGADTLRYSYPLIQYKVLNGQAAMVCLNEGADAVGEFFASGNYDVRLGERAATLVVDRIEPRQWQVQVWDQMFGYRLWRWLPLNGENYRQWQADESPAARAALLQRVLTGNILSLAKGLGIGLEAPVKAAITSMDEPRSTVAKGVRMLTVNATFTTNVSLPLQAGLGKHASLGYGVVSRLKNKTQDDTGNRLTANSDSTDNDTLHSL